MRVKHLIRELQKLDPELPVSTEGCDCYGDSYRVDFNSRWGEVIIYRSSHAESDYNNGDDTPHPIEPNG